MYYTGFADEGAKDLSGQIAATKALGWNCIESRNIDGVNIHNLSQEAFDKAAEEIESSGIQVNCFGSTLANWGCKITDPFEKTLDELSRAIPRMQRLGTRMIRIMSYAVLGDREPDDQMEEERFRRVRILTERLLDSGIQPVHENCMNYGGMGWQFTERLLENVPGLKLVYDTGNPVFLDDRSKPKPYPKESSWEFYEHVREHVVYVHIKDCTWDPVEKKAIYTWAGDGDGDVRRIVTDLLKRGYDGGFSMEPHMQVVFHDDGVQAQAQARFDNYVEYGRRFMALVEACRKGL